MSMLDPDAFDVFREGIRTIWCRHSPGAVLSGKSPAPGVHAHREILLVLRGSGDFPLNHKLIAPQPGDVVMIDAWIAHCAGYSADDRDLLHCWIHLRRDRISMWFVQLDFRGRETLGSPRFPLPGDLQMLLNRRWDAFDKLPEQEALKQLDSCMREPLTMLLDEIRYQFSRHSDGKTADAGERRIVPVIQRLIEAENGRNCSLERLETVTGYNRYYLAHRFKRATGLSIGDYISRVRLNFTAAAEKCGMRHKEIAFELGFSSPSAFACWLRKARRRNPEAGAETLPPV